MKISISFICLILNLTAGGVFAAVPTELCKSLTSAGCTLDLPLKNHPNVSRLFSSSQLQSLKKLADYLRANRKQDVQIEGHVAQSGEIEIRDDFEIDEKGQKSVEADLELGEKIADAAKKYLLSQGVDAQQVTTISYGSEKPLKENAKDPSNYRVVIVPLTADGSSGDVGYDIIPGSDTEATIE